MNKFLQNLKNLKSLKNLTQIFKWTNGQMDMSKTQLVGAVVSPKEVQQPTNIQGISNLSLTFSSIKYAICVLLMLVMGVGEMWGATVTRTWKAGVAVNQGSGTVKVTIYKHDWGAPNDESKYTVGDDATKQSSDGTVQTATDSETQGGNWVTSTAALLAISYRSCWYEVVSIPDGYAWKGWYDGSGNKKTGDQTYKPWTKTKDNKDETYYAKFNAVTVNSVSSNPISSSSSALKLTEPGSKTADIKFAVSYADATADFSEPTVSGAGWTLNTWSYADNVVTVNVKYTATNTTTQGDHTATVTLTSKGTSSNQSKSATVYANVDLTPHISASPTELDFGMFTIGVDDNMRKTVTLTFDANAINFSLSTNINPFKATLSNDHKTLAIDFNPTSVGEWTKTITVTTKNKQNPELSASQTITLKGAAQSKTYPTYTCNIENTYMVDDAAIDLQSLWTSTSNGAITYSIESYTEHGSNNSAGTKPAITSNHYLSLGRACEIALKLTQKDTTSYFTSSDTKTITIKKYETSFDGPAYNLMVDATQDANYTYTNTSAAQPTASSSDDFYYTIDQISYTNESLNQAGGLVTFEPSNNNMKITAKNAGTGKITLHQKETYKYTGATTSFDVKVDKYNSAFSGAAALDVKVEESKDSGYKLTYTKPNSGYVGDVPTAGNPGLGEASGAYYYTLTQNVTTDKTEGSADASIAAAYDAGTKKATGKNAGTCTVNLYQKETYKVYAATPDSFVVTVTKNENTIYVKGNANYSSSIYTDSYDSDLTLTATNTNYTDYPISCTQTEGTDIATFYRADKVVYSSYKLGKATWSLHQDENYRYKEANGSFSVTVKKAAEATNCYVVTNKSTSASSPLFGGERYGDAIALDGTGDKLTFYAKRTGLGDVSIVQYSKDGSTWHTWLTEIGIDAAGKTFGPYKFSDIPNGDGDKVTHLRFGVSGSTSSISYYYSSIYVTRKTYLNASDLTINQTSKGSPVYPSDGTGVGKLKIDYSLANGGDLKILNDNDKFTLSKTTISNVDCKTGTETITIEYQSATAGTDYAHLLIYNDVYRKEVTITGITVLKTPTVTWTPDATIFNVGEELTATNGNGLSVALSVAPADAAYVTCQDNKAVMTAEKKPGTVTVTAHVTGNTIYADADIKKTITITNKEKQYINWSQDFSRLKTTDDSKLITLNATTTSGIPVTYKLEGDATGLSLSKNEQTGVWTLTYSNQVCKNTTIVAEEKQGNDTYAPAASVSKPVKVIDPTKACDVNTTVINSDTEMKNRSEKHPIDIPDTMIINARLTNPNWSFLYSNDFKVKFYDEEENQIGETKSYDKDRINSSDPITLTGLSRDAKFVELISEASLGYTVSSLTYKQQKYCETDKKTLNFVTNPNTKPEMTFTVNYANYPISLECENKKFTISPESFGDCGEKGTQTVTVTYTAGAGGTDNGNILYIKDNTGVVLEKCTLNVTINKLTQGIESTNIASSYNTTDRVELSATTNSGLSDFTYSVTPTDVASISGNVLTFKKSGTISITISEPGDGVYQPCSTTVANVTVNKVTPTLTLPTGTNATYLQNLSTSTLSGGKATVTLRGVANTEVAGSFAWTNGTTMVNGAAGTNSYEVTFTPENKDMYNPATGMVEITVAKANQAIKMNNGTVNVAVNTGSDANSADSQLNLTNLIASQTTDALDANRTGAVSYEVISENSAKATISGTIFSATAAGEYKVRATKAATNYYNAATDEFTVTVNARANTLDIASACTKYVGQEVTDVLTNVNSNGEIHAESTDGTIAYYDIVNKKIVIPNSEAKSFDQTKVTITIWQDATAQFVASDVKTIEVTVKKYDNAITCDWGTWSKTLNFDERVDVHFISNNTAAVNAPIEVTQILGDSIATYNRAQNAIYAAWNIGQAKWEISQAENYMYKAASAQTLTVTVDKLKAEGCYVLNETAEHSMGTTGLGSLEGLSPIETTDSLELSAPGTDLYFDAKKDAAGGNFFFIEYSTNGSQFKILGDEVQLSSSYKTYGPYPLPEGTKYVRFKTTAGATLTKHYKNVRVTRKTYFDIEDKDGLKISSMDMPLNLVSNDPINVNSSKKSFYIDYNTCDDEIHISSNHPYYTIKEADKAFSASTTNGVGRREIEVTYTCATSDTSSAVISVYTKYDHKTITINGHTDKGTQELNWKQPDFVTDTVSLPVGYLGIAATVSSGLPLTYSILQDEDSVIRIAEDKYSFEVIGEGTAHLTVTQEGTTTLHPVTGTRVIVATGKKLQMIRWFQDLTNSLTEGDTVRLEAEVYVMNSRTGVYAKDDARTSLLQYTCPENNGKIVVFGGDSLRVIGTGQTTLTASVGGDDFYVAAASVTMPINIRSLSDTCQSKLLVNYTAEQTFEPDVDWGFTNLNLTKAEYGDTILIDQTVGKPDKLSFMHSGTAYVAPVINTEHYQGAIKAQQRIRGAWVDVAGSRVSPTKGVWHELSNIQLDENADAVMIMREQGAFGYHHVKDIKVTMLPYLRAEETIFISTEVGAKVDTTITLQYANAKAALTAETKRKANDVFVVRNSVFYPNCGTIGTYNWPIRFTPTTIGDWLDTVVIKDSGTEDSILVYIQASVAPSAVFVYQTDTMNGQWNQDGNWGHNGALPTEDDHVIIKSDVIIPENDIVYVKSLTIEETATVKVNGTLVVMESTPDRFSYGNIHVRKNGYVDLHNITVGALKINDFILDAALGGVTSTGFSGQVESAEKLVVNGDAYFQMTLNPSGSNTLGWYDFVVPFEVEVMGGISIAGDNTPLVFNDNYAVMNYSEAKRAEKGKDWNKFRGTMEPGKVYTIAVDAEHPEWNTVLFKKKDGVSITGDRTYTTEYSSAIGEVKDRGWNGFGNGTLRHAKLDFNEGDDTKVQLYNRAKYCYQPKEAKDVTIAVGTSFFIQYDAVQSVKLSPATTNTSFLAPLRSQRTTSEFRLAMTSEEGEKVSDHLWVSASEEATGEYVIGHDLLKMGTPSESKIAQVWAKQNSNRLCDIEMPLDNNGAHCDLGIFAPQARTYSLAVEKAPQDVVLYLTYNGRPIWNLTMSPYEFDLEQGTTEGYGLQLYVRQAPEVATGVDGVQDAEIGARKVLINDKIYLITPEGAIFSVTGKKIQ